MSFFQPKVSIIIPVYNGSNFLREAINSALDQTYKNIEIIIVNDGSDDNGETENIALSYDAKVRYIYKKNGGVASALNTGIDHMQGEYFSWLSHDDLYSKNKIKLQMDLLASKKNRNVVVYSSFLEFNQNVNDSEKFKMLEVTHSEFRYWLATESSLHGCSLLIPKKMFDEVGKFNESLLCTQDYDMWFRLASKYRFYCIHEWLVYSRKHPEQTGKKIAKVANDEANDLNINFLKQLTQDELCYAAKGSLCYAYAKISYSLSIRNINIAAEKAKMLSLKHKNTALPNEMPIINKYLNLSLKSFVTKGTEKNINVLQLNGYESPGKRFNGISIAPLLKKKGFHSKHFIWEKDTEDPKVLSFNNPLTRKCNEIVNKIERKLSIQSLLYPHPWKMIKMPEFQLADILHLHIIHSGYFNLFALPKMTKLKPTIWTLHDPWALTGHCVHFFDCTRWQNECGKCPNLNSEFKLNHDNTRFLFRNKKRIYNKSKFEVIVASKWMKEKVELSPLFENVKLHYLPFGIDLNFFSPVHIENARRRFGLQDDEVVICFRAVPNEFKGLEYIISALDILKTDKKIVLLTLNDCGTLNQFKDRYKLIPLEWTNDDILLRDAIAAADIFLMPSIVEAFGMMAIEALACEKPVIVFDGTALPDVVFAPNVGISVPPKDVIMLCQTLHRLIENPNERRTRGKLGRIVAEQNYDVNTHVDKLSGIYHGVLK